MHHYPRSPGDYRRDTPHLTLVQHGAYALLLDWYYASGKPLPDDMALLNRICGAVKNADRMAVASVVAEFFPLIDGAHHNRRCDAEIAKYAGNSKGGSKGMKTRWGDDSLNKSPDKSNDNSPHKSPDNNQNENQNENHIPPNPQGGNGRAWVPSETQKRLNKLFRRKDSTAWSAKERKAFKALGEIASEDLDRLERYYSARIPDGKDYRRRDLTTLLNNFHGEVDRARNFKEQSLF